MVDRLEDRRIFRGVLRHHEPIIPRYLSIFTFAYLLLSVYTGFIIEQTRNARFSGLKSKKQF